MSKAEPLTIMGYFVCIDGKPTHGFVSPAKDDFGLNLEAHAKQACEKKANAMRQLLDALMPPFLRKGEKEHPITTKQLPIVINPDAVVILAPSPESWQKKPVDDSQEKFLEDNVIPEGDDE